MVAKQLPVPEPPAGMVLIKVLACGVCRTDLHIVDGELNAPQLPLIPGHEIIGTVCETGADTDPWREGDIVGVPWLAHTCGQCRFCRSSRENLCDRPLFTGYSVNGGFAEYTLAYTDYCYRLPAVFNHPAAAPLMCAGLIGYRSYRMLPETASAIGIYGFGAAGHILIQLARWQKKDVYVFCRQGDRAAKEFALRMGASWAGDSTERAPVPLGGAIIFAPVGALVPEALKNLDKGGTLVCGGIHMSDIPSFPYSLLWQERVIRSVANLQRSDGVEFLELARLVPVQTEARCYPLEQANNALSDLRSGRISGAAVLLMSAH